MRSHAHRFSTYEAEARETAADTLKAASSALSPYKTGLGQKLAIAGTIYKLARRYPVPALVVGGVALAFYLGRRNAQARYYQQRY